MPSNFQSTRPPSNLLIKSKRPVSPSSTTTTSTSQPTLIICSSAKQNQPEKDSDSDSDKRKEPQRIEVDFSAAPQQFLDPAVWERMQAIKSWSALPPQSKQSYTSDVEGTSKYREGGRNIQPATETEPLRIPVLNLNCLEHHIFK